MVNFDTQYTNINYPNNNTSNKKAVLKNDDVKICKKVK